MRWRAVGIAACALLVQSATVSAQTGVPVVGLLSSRSEADSQTVVEDLRKGLDEAGYAEPGSVLIEYRWADGRYDRLQGLAAELVRRNVAVLATTGGIVSALAAKEATSVVPIVFTVGDDPVRHGLVGSLNRPGGNATGVVIMAADLGSKRLELVHEMVPSASHVVILVNPANPNMNAQAGGLRDTASKLGLRLTVLSASHEPEIDSAFETMAREGAGALLVGADPFLHSRRDRIVALAATHRVPAIYEDSEFVRAGGLASYGPSRRDAVRLVGVYAGRILAGARPQDLPVQAPTKFEMAVNLRTAGALGIEIPPTVMVRADEVIE